MSNLKEKDLRLLFEAGALKKAMITAAPLEPGCYNVSFQQGVETLFYRGHRSDDVKVFKSSDAAISAVRNVGFRTFVVDLGSVS